MTQWRNTPDQYGVIARWLHWIIALLFVCAYVAVYYRHWFTEKETPENMVALHLHLSFGISIAAFVVLRVIWTLTNPKPQPLPGPAWQHRAARLAHGTLYFFMIIMPITGYTGTKLAAEFFYLFTVPKFPDTWLFTQLVQNGLGLSFEQWEEYVDFIHKKSGEYLVWVLVLVHAAAALWHHFHLRDRTLLRMWRGGNSGA